MKIHVCAAGETEGREIDLRPSKVLAIGQNYRAHAAEMGKPVPAEPVVFLKPPSAVIPGGTPIVRPTGFSRIDYEGELGVVIGRRARRVAATEALDYVMGFTCVNDVSNRDLQKRDGQWGRAKGFDTFCPIGPRIVSGLDPRDLRITTRLNGEVRQDSRTSDMIFPVPVIIEELSRVMTLEVGDVITTGTPQGVGPILPGDTVEIEIEGIGVLANPVTGEG